MRDQILYNALKDLTVRYMSVLRDSVLRRGGLPQRLVPKVEFGKDGSFSVGSESKPDFRLLAATTALDFVNDKTNEALTNGLLRHGSIASLLKDKGASVVPMAFAYNILQPMITRQLIMQDGVEFKEAEFESNYKSFEDYLNSEEDEYLLSAPLANFAMEADMERVGPFNIRKLNADEFAVYNGIAADSDSLARIFPFGHLRFVLEMTAVVKRGFPALTQTHQDCFWWFVAIMKLTETGSVGFDTIWCRPLSWTGMSVRVGTAYPRRRIVGRPYTLQSQSLPRLRHYWKLVEQIAEKQPPFWKVALQRFCDAVDRPRPDEALVDYWIACESLFGEDVEFGEFAYRLSLRIAHFLGTEPVERKKIRATVKEAYRARGLLLHGARNLDQSKLMAQTSAMEEITREALCKCLKDQIQSRDEMIRQIEASIVGNPAPQ